MRVVIVEQYAKLSLSSAISRSPEGPFLNQLPLLNAQGIREGHRYDPTIGEWVNPDPMGFAAGDSNLQRYVGNSVTYATDPSGLQQISRRNWQTSFTRNYPMPTDMGDKTFGFSFDMDIIFGANAPKEDYTIPPGVAKDFRPEIWQINDVSVNAFRVESSDPNKRESSPLTGKVANMDVWAIPRRVPNGTADPLQFPVRVRDQLSGRLKGSAAAKQIGGGTAKYLFGEILVSRSIMWGTTNFITNKTDSTKWIVPLNDDSRNKAIEKTDARFPSAQYTVTYVFYDSRYDCVSKQEHVDSARQELKSLGIPFSTSGHKAATVEALIIGLWQGGADKVWVNTSYWDGDIPPKDATSSNPNTLKPPRSPR